jgi:hypothetical protein
MQSPANAKYSPFFSADCAIADKVVKPRTQITNLMNRGKLPGSALVAID